MKSSNQKSLADEKERYYKKLTLRNTVINLILFISPFVLLFFIINQQTSSLIKNQIYSQLSDSVEENINTINTFLRDREVDLRSYSKLDIRRAEETLRFSSFLDSLVREKKWYDFMVIADLEGEVVLSVNRDIKGNIKDREYFKVSRQGKSFSTGIFYSEALKSPLMILSHPLISRTGQIIGVLAASLNLENFYNLLFELRIGKTSEL
ncbi:MAG: cache domain-containing protein, partial [Candidatus Aminicenantes bacterium]